MSFPVNSDLDLLSISHLRNALLDTLAADPSSPASGQFWFNTTGKVLRIYDGTTTQTVAYLSNRLDQFATPTTNLSMGNNKITNVANPTGSGDAATWDWVNSVVQGYDWKQSCIAATTAGDGNITLAGGAPTTLDTNVNLTAGDRILVKNQTNAAENGLYFVSTLGTGSDGTWLRTPDADTSSEVTTGLTTFIEEGYTNASTAWTLTTPNPITLGVTPLTFTQTSGSGTYTATSLGSGTAIYAGQAGNQFQFYSLASPNAAITVSLNTDMNYVWLTFNPGEVDKNSLGGEALTVANGGTGSGNASGARASLGAAASGANSDITSLSGLTTALSVPQGGTGATTLTGYVKGNADSAFTASTTIPVSDLSGTLAVTSGGTGATTASGARSNLGAAASGANSDITSLTGLTTALSAAQGGTGQSSYTIGDLLYASTTTALSKLNDVATGNALISGGVGTAPSYGKIGLTTHVSGTLPVANGGTGGTTASDARSNLGAAASGANSDITSLSGLTTALSVAQGGTGAATAAGAKTNLGFITKYAVNNSAGTSTTVTHNLGTTDITVQVWELSGSKRQVLCEVDITNSNSVVVYTPSAPSAGAYRIVVMG